MLIHLFLSTILSATDTANADNKNGKAANAPTKTDVKIKNNGDNNGTATMEINKALAVKNVFLKTYARPKDKNTAGDTKGTTKDAKDTTKNAATDNTANNTGTATTNGEAADDNKNKKPLKLSTETDAKKLKADEYIVTTKDNKTTIIIGQNSFSDKDLSFIHVTGQENKTGKATTDKENKSAATDGTTNADGKNKTANGTTGDANAGTTGDANNATTGDGTVLRFVSKDGIIITDGKLATQSLKDFNDGKTANNNDGSVWKSWWFWLIVVAGLVLIVFIIFYFCKGSTD